MKVSVLLIVLLAWGSAFAGKPLWNNVGYKEEKGWTLKIRSAGFQGSLYHPDLGFWNKESPIRYWDKKFNSMPLAGACAEAGLGNRCGLRGELGYASATARQTNIAEDLGGGSQFKKLSLTPVNLIFLYDLKYDSAFIPYVGAGAGMVFVSSRNVRYGNPDSFQSESNASDYMTYAVGGVRCSAGEKISVGAEIRGALGSYSESVTDTHQNSSVKDISLNGVQVMISLNYNF
jgi:opacity protein-like surface antigen